MMLYSRGCFRVWLLLGDVMSEGGAGQTNERLARCPTALE